MNDALARVELLHVDDAVRDARSDTVIAEAPVALLYNGTPFAVMMATPDALDDFALGFALSEGIVTDAAEFRLVDVVRNDDGVALHAAIPQARFDALQMRRRGLEGRSGCGLCGVESLRDAMRAVPRAIGDATVSLHDIGAALSSLANEQPLNARSGGVHAAGFAIGPDLVLVREDVGRHNALDKLVGAMAKMQPPPDRKAGFLVMTSRASYEIVFKAAHAGLATIVAISAPTTLAIQTARDANITLAAFARGDSLNLYCHPWRITA
jgi:formate dehydrogenase accessory protein FdhD